REGHEFHSCRNCCRSMAASSRWGTAALRKHFSGLQPLGEYAFEPTHYRALAVWHIQRRANDHQRLATYDLK
ncbi:MAG: hypothetical protein WBV41_00170, partial [Terriglobales bacterium]